MERLPDLARQVATVAAALGRRVSLDHVAAMLKVSPSELLTPVDELIRADLLTERDGVLMFGHDLTFEAVRASVPLSVRRSLDRQAASVLLAGGALPVEVATQLADSAEPGDEVAITTLFKAAEAMGLNTTRYKITAFVVGAFFAGLAGGGDLWVVAGLTARKPAAARMNSEPNMISCRRR